MKNKKVWIILGVLLLAATRALAADETPTIETNKTAIDLVQSHADYVWTMVAAALVFFMQAGFAMVETGFTRAKNAVNILMKNLMDFSIGTLAFWAIGFGLMFGVSSTGWLGTSGFFLSDWKPGGDPWVLAFWMFQVVFCATAATIVSGAMAERTKFSSYIIYSCIVSAIIYPIFGGWAWGSLYNGSGWLEGLGFIDFAGSTVVHSVGGWMALAGAIVLGPRLGKYGPDGKPRAIPGHNLPLAALGVFILWLGWFGFNPGSTTAAVKDISWIFVNTNLAAAAGAVVAMIVSWLKFGKPEISMSLNGALAGLVAIYRSLLQRQRLSQFHNHRRRGRRVGGLLGVVLRQDQSRRPGRRGIRARRLRRLGNPGRRSVQYRRRNRNHYRCSVAGHRGLFRLGIRRGIDHVQTDRRNFRSAGQPGRGSRRSGFSRTRRLGLPRFPDLRLRSEVIEVEGESK